MFCLIWDINMVSAIVFHTSFPVSYFFSLSPLLFSHFSFYSFLMFNLFFLFTPFLFSLCTFFAFVFIFISSLLFYLIFLVFFLLIFCLHFPSFLSLSCFSSFCVRNVHGNWSACLLCLLPSRLPTILLLTF